MTSAFAAGAGEHREHPDVAEISALTEGLPSPEGAAMLRAHLADCALCSDVQASLKEIRSTLGTLPGPTRIPSEIASRIDAALAAEALLDSTAPGDPATAAPPEHRSPEASTAVSRETSAAIPGVNTAGNSLAGSAHEETAESLPEAPTGVSRETTAPELTPVRAARTAELASTDVSPGSVSRSLSARPSADRRPAGHGHAATGPGRSSTPRRRRRDTTLLSTAGLIAALTLGAVLFFSLDTTPDDSGRDPSTMNQRAAEQDLNNRVRDLLAEASTDRTLASPGISTQQNDERSPHSPLSSESASAAAPACVRKGIGRPETPLAAAEHNYNGTDAYLVVLPHVSDPRRVDAYIVDAACATDASAPPGPVLHTKTFPRP